MPWVPGCWVVAAGASGRCRGRRRHSSLGGGTGPDKGPQRLHVHRDWTAGVEHSGEGRRSGQMMGTRSAPGTPHSTQYRPLLASLVRLPPPMGPHLPNSYIIWLPLPSLGFKQPPYLNST